MRTHPHADLWRRVSPGLWHVVPLGRVREIRLSKADIRLLRKLK